MNWTILGLECSDGDKCECCGASCPKRRVVLSNGEQEVRYGSSCAAMKLLGNKKAGSVKVITTKATAAGLARKWIKAGHSAEVVAKGIGKRFGYMATATQYGVEIPGIGLVA